MLTQQKLKKFLHYNPDTGIFTRLCKSSNACIGDIAGTTSRERVKIRVAGNRPQYAHRLVWLYMYGFFPKAIDHINGISTDNRLVNLRTCSQSLNMQNQRVVHKGNYSGYLGVSWHKSTKSWVARIQCNNVQRHIGCFNNPKEAHKAYLTEKRRRHEYCTI